MVKATVERRLLEPDIKSLVLNYMLSKKIISPSGTVFSEFTIDNASRRVDLAIVKEEELWAFEIKSEADSLARLKGQVEMYSKYFDKVFVVVAKKHINSALNILPNSIALWEVRDNEILIRRRGRKQFIKNSSVFIEMMNVSDLSKLATKYNLKVEKKRREDLVHIIKREVNIKTLRASALQAVIERYSLSSNAFFDQIEGRSVTPKDIELLSRFKPFSKKDNLKSDEIDNIIRIINSIED